MAERIHCNPARRQGGGVVVVSIAEMENLEVTRRLWLEACDKLHKAARRFGLGRPGSDVVDLVIQEVERLRGDGKAAIVEEV